MVDFLIWLHALESVYFEISVDPDDVPISFFVRQSCRTCCFIRFEARTSPSKSFLGYILYYIIMNFSNIDYNLIWQHLFKLFLCLGFRSWWLLWLLVRSRHLRRFIFWNAWRKITLSTRRLRPAFDGRCCFCWWYYLLIFFSFHNID